MGYESTLYIVNTFNNEIDLETGKKFAQVLAMVELAKVYELREIFNKETEYYFCHNSSEEAVLEDGYGEPLREAELDDVVKAIENYMEIVDWYLLRPALALLKVYQEMNNKYLKVIHYGH